MSKYGEVTFTGKSKTTYMFTAYSWDTEFKAIGGVYSITKRTVKSAGRASHKYIYIGQTEDLSERFDDHHKASCFSKESANCICARTESDKDTRLAIESDLIENYDPPCNE